MAELAKQFYFLSPVQVVRVTRENMADVAAWCGGEIAETESKRHPGRMDPYVWVPTPKGTRISWAFAGMFVTRRIAVSTKGELKATWAVFSRDYFENNYFVEPLDAVEATWGKEEKQPKAKQEAATSIQGMVGLIRKNGRDEERFDKSREWPEDGDLDATPAQVQALDSHTEVIEQTDVDLSSGVVEETVGRYVLRESPDPIKPFEVPAEMGPIARADLDADAAEAPEMDR